MAQISPTKFAEIIGVSRQRVLTAIKTGLLSQSVSVKKSGKSKRYLIDEKAGKKEWADNIDQAKQRDNSKQEATKEMQDADGPGASNYQKARAAKEFYNANMAKLDFLKAAEKLIMADTVRSECFKIARRVRDSILGVPERVAPELANMDDPRSIAIYIKEQLAEALKDLGDMDNVGKPRSK